MTLFCVHSLQISQIIWTNFASYVKSDTKTITSLGNFSYPEINISPLRIWKLKRARQLAYIAGQCIALAKIIVPAKLLLRGVYKTLRQRKTWEMVLTQVKADWNSFPVVIRPKYFRVTIDASHIGWGGTLGTLSASGQWNQRLQFYVNNFILLTEK